MVHWWLDEYPPRGVTVAEASQRKRRRFSLRRRWSSHIKASGRTTRHRNAFCIVRYIFNFLFSKKMQSSTMFVFSLGIIALVMAWNEPASAVPPPQCSPSFLMNADAKYRQICLVLSQLQNAYEVAEDRVSDPFEPIDTGIKRKDVDHVFLRFGRPRM